MSNLDRGFALANTDQGSEVLPELVMMGRIIGLFGTRGWLKIHSFTRPRSNLFEYRDWWVGQPGQWRTYQLSDHKVNGSTLLGVLAEITGREHAVALLKASIAIPRAALRQPSVGEYYWSDLLGAVVVNRDGVALGEIKRLVEAGDHDVMVVRGAREYLIPFVAQIYVLSVDLGARRILVDWHVDD